MLDKLAAALGAAVVLGGIGFVWGSTSSAGPTTSTSAPVSTVFVAVPTTAAAPDTHSFEAGDAGTVTYRVDGGVLTLIDATPNPGWRVDVERVAGREIDLDFRSGLRRVQVDVEFEDGGVRERVRPRLDGDNSGPGGHGT